MSPCAEVTDDEEYRQTPSNNKVKDEKIDISPSLADLHDTRRQNEAARLEAAAELERYAPKYEAEKTKLHVATMKVREIVSNNLRSLDIKAHFNLG